MKSLERMTMLTTLAFCMTTTLLSDEPNQPELNLPKPGPEYKLLQADVGSWDVEIKTWNEAGEPVVSKGTETNRMLGGFWLLSDFQGNMMGMDFQGHGVYSYDDEKKQYVGTWIDSMGPNKMEMVGKHDAVKNTMTYEGIGPGPDGNPAKHVMATDYKDDGTRVMTMHVKAGEEMIKIFEMRYTKAEDADQ